MFLNLFSKKPKISARSIDQDEVVEYSAKVAAEAHFLALKVIENAGLNKGAEYADVMRAATFALFFIVKREIHGAFGDSGSILFDLMLHHMINYLVVHLKPTIPVKAYQDQTLKYYYVDQDEYMKCRKWTSDGDEPQSGTLLWEISKRLTKVSTGSKDVAIIYVNAEAFVDAVVAINPKKNLSRLICV